MSKRLAVGRVARKVIGATLLILGAMITNKKDMKSKRTAAQMIGKALDTHGTSTLTERGGTDGYAPQLPQQNAEWSR